MVKLVVVVEQSWLDVVVVAVPFETIAACDTRQAPSW